MSFQCLRKWDSLLHGLHRTQNKEIGKFWHGRALCYLTLHCIVFYFNSPVNMNLSSIGLRFKTHRYATLW